MAIFAAGGGFRRGGRISQRRVNFTTISQPISQLQNEGTELRNGTRVPIGGFAAAKPPARWGFLGVEAFATISQLRNEGGGLRNGTRVPKGCFAAAKIFAEGGMGLRNHFAVDGRFRSGYLRAAKLFRSQGPFSQGPFLGCEISQTLSFPCF
uniref:Uncharacterized protein n=1 Tax=Vitis vinifera TaxID=29760 RepID=A5AIL0_VITVI|nr:hypothetical protein VITISV_033754 [Vitis vinifera]